jgi:hypothetical protein
VKAGDAESPAFSISVLIPIIPSFRPMRTVGGARSIRAQKAHGRTVVYRSSWKKHTLAATACALALSGLPGVAAAGDDPFAAYEHQPVNWTTCPYKQEEGAKTAQCALITVPRDWAAPSSGHDLKVAISRVVATGDRKGAILVNPGGPGAWGTRFASEIADLEPALNERYDFIGLDPRGTGQEGATDPALQPSMCVIPSRELPQGKDLDARDRSPKSIAEHQKKPRATAQACPQ